jgi:hypothetical protein
VLTIINNETKQQEIWYMHLEANATSTSVVSLTESSSSLALASSTDVTGTTTTIDTSSTTSSTAKNAPVVDLLNTKWKKYEPKDPTIIETKTIVEEIQKQEVEAVVDAQVIKDTLPDFAVDTIKRMKGAFLNMVLVQVQKGTSTDELWVYNALDGTQEKIGIATSSISITTAPDTPLGLKDRYVFWLSLDKSLVYAYNLETKTILEQPLPSFDQSVGERAEINFDGILWKVIVSKEGFSFYSPATGEVFSDEDSRIVEALRQKMSLDTVLDKDALSNLSLPVSADTVVSTPAP